MAETGRTRRLAAILSADVVGYSRLMADDDRATLDTLQRYRAAIGRIVDKHGGRVVNTPGDALLAEFASARAALAAAVEVQRGIEARNEELAETRRMRFRIGLSVGDVLVEPDGTLYGDGVNIAARMEALSEAGGICLSSMVHDHVRGEALLGFEDLGPQAVKNFADPVRAYKVLPGKPAEGAPAREDRPRMRAPVAVAAVVGVAVIAGAALLWQPWRESAPPEPEVASTRAIEPASVERMAFPLPEEPSIAVLPFDNLSGDPEQAYFADGVSEQIIAGLARFRELVVIARNSSFQYKGGAQDLREVGRVLGARYLVEGSVRKSGETVRVTAQLIDASTDAHLWAETFERGLTASNLFAIQDQITEKVVGAIAGAHGIIARARQQAEAGIRTEDLAAYDCVLRANAFRTNFEPAGHARARDCLERTVETNPDYAEAWALLSIMCIIEHVWGWNARPDPLARSLAAAQRAVALDPNNENAQLALVRPYFFLGDIDRLLAAGERAVSMNPLNADVVGTAGYFMALAGRWERGLELVRQAMALSPIFPRFWHGAFFWDHYRRGEYEAALAEAKSGMIPDAWTAQLNVMLAAAQLGDTATMQEALDRQLALKPDYADSVRSDLRNFIPGAVYFPPELLERVAEGLRKAGIEIADVGK